MKSSGDPPPAPDPTQSANAQSGANIATAIANARLNRINQQTPWGSISYTQGPADANGVPTYSSQIQLSPAQQQLLEQQQQQGLMRGQISQQILANSGGSLGQPLDLSDLPGVYMPTGGGHGTTWAGTHARPVGMAVPQIQPMGAPAGAPTGGQQSPLSVVPSQTPTQTPGASSTAAALAQLLRGGQQSSSSSAVPTYQDYLAANPQNSGGSEGGQGTSSALSQAQWNALSDADKWKNVGSGMAIGRDDPRYAQMAQQLGMSDGGRINLGYQPQSIGANSRNYVDPNAMVRDGNVFATAHSNETPATQFAGGGLSDKEWAILAATLIGGGALAGGALGADGAAAGAGEGAGTGAFDVGGSTGFGGSTAMGGGEAAAAGVPITDLSVQASQPSLWSQMLTNLQNGHGLLGLSTGQRTAVGLIPQLLQAANARNGQGGGK